jgi:hypothetical protein
MSSFLHWIGKKVDDEFSPETYSTVMWTPNEKFPIDLSSGLVHSALNNGTDLIIGCIDEVDESCLKNVCRMDMLVDCVSPSPFARTSIFPGTDRIGDIVDDVLNCPSAAKAPIRTLSLRDGLSDSIYSNDAELVESDVGTCIRLEMVPEDQVDLLDTDKLIVVLYEDCKFGYKCVFFKILPHECLKLAKERLNVQMKIEEQCKFYLRDRKQAFGDRLLNDDAVLWDLVDEASLLRVVPAGNRLLVAPSVKIYN